MNEIKDDHHSQHQHGIENIQEVLMPEQVAVITLDIFDNAEAGAHHDQHTIEVEGVEVLVPDAVTLLGLLGQQPVQADVEGERHKNEEPEEGDLYKEPADDDFLTQVHGVETSGGHDPAAYKEMKRFALAWLQLSSSFFLVFPFDLFIAPPHLLSEEKEEDGRPREREVKVK